MKNNKKKGFTLVELLVVIAIIAILSSVTIVGYLGFTEKAKQTNDNALLTQLNTILEGNKVVDKKNDKFSDVINDLENEGFKLDQLKASSTKNDLLWNQDEDKMYLVPKNETPDNAWKYWGVFDEIPENQLYSMYLTGSDKTVDVEIKTGLDLGKNINVNKIIYSGNKGDTFSKPMLITNNPNCIIDINNEKANLDWYGKASIINVNEAANNSIHIYGTSNQITLTKGRLCLEDTARVQKVLVKSLLASDVEISVKATAIVNSVSTTKEVSEKITNSLKGSNVTVTTLCDSGDGSALNPFMVSDANQLKNISAGGYFKLNKDIELTIKFSDSGLESYIDVLDDASLDLNGKKITVKKATKEHNGANCLFAVYNNVTLTFADTSETGFGVIDTNETNTNSIYVCNVNGVDANVIVNSGIYTGGPTCFQVQKGTLTVNGGTLSLNSKCLEVAPSLNKYIINCIDATFKDGSAKINVTGGTFGFDPSANPEGENTTYVKEGCTVVDNKDGTWTVSQ